jgi:hypothetical protein
MAFLRGAALLLAETEELLFGLEFGVFVLGAGDEDAVLVAEVGAPGTAAVPRFGRTCHGEAPLKKAVP